MTKHDLKEMRSLGAELGAAKAENDRLRGLLRTAWRLRPDHDYHDEHMQAEQKAWEVETAEVLNAAPIAQTEQNKSALHRAITHYEAALQAAFPSGSPAHVSLQWDEARRQAKPDTAQTAPRPTGLSKGWNLVRQSDGFVIGHSSEAPSQRHKEQALADGRTYVPFLVVQTAPQPEQSGLVEATLPAVRAAERLSSAIIHRMTDRQYQKVRSEFGDLQDALVVCRAALSAQRGEA
jgi:hypothetical protein